jgi:hypothetical protein
MQGILHILQIDLRKTFLGNRSNILKTYLLLGTIILSSSPVLLNNGLFIETITQNHEPAKPQPIVTNEKDHTNLSNFLIVKHHPDETELMELEQKVGVAEVSSGVNLKIGTHGTGLDSPTRQEWTQIENNLFLIDSVPFNGSLPAQVDHSKDACFPPIGNQDGEGSCVCWAVGYYVKTYQEAKEHGWNVSAAQWVGGYHGYPTVSFHNQIFSPDFIYHLINSGRDQGSNYFDAINLVCNVGVATWDRMPYTPTNCTTWPSEDAWHEASLYRSNGSAYESMTLDTDSSIVNLKNWIALGNLAIISIDANKFTNFTSNDVWTLDNYVNPSTNHANTIVGYDDNFSYVEQGILRHGVFKIANSWGVGGWEKAPDGFYWISYQAMKQAVGYCMFYQDAPAYQPEILASFRIQHPHRAECDIVIGVGNMNYPTQTKRFNNYIYGGNLPFPSNDIVIDITEFENKLTTLRGQQFFLKVYDGDSPTDGNITDFSINYLHTHSVPISTQSQATVYVTLTYSPATQLRVFPQLYSLSNGSAIGKNVTVAIVAEDILNLSSFNIKFSWNPNYLGNVALTTTVPSQNYPSPNDPSPYGGILNSGAYISLNKSNETAGTLEIICKSSESTPAFSGNGTIAVITLAVNHQSNATVQLPLNVTQSVLYDKYGLTLLRSVQNGLVTIPATTNKTPPHISVYLPQSQIYATRTIPLIFHVDRPCSWISYSLDNEANITVATNATIDNLVEGTHQLTLYAEDASGDTGRSEKIEFTIDITPPIINVLSPKNATYQRSPVELELAISEQASWITYSFDGGANVTMTSNLNLTCSVQGLHNLIFYAADIAGNTAASKPVDFIVDIIPPIIANISQWPSIQNIKPDIGVSINATVTDAISGVEIVSLNYTIGDGHYTVIKMSSLGISTWNTNIPPFGHGTKISYMISAFDKSDNRMTSPLMSYEYPNQLSEFAMVAIAAVLMVIFCLTVAILAALLKHSKAQNLDASFVG